MDVQRLFERIGEYRKALARLREAAGLDETDIIRDAIIQRFEFTHELAWKALKLWLEYKNIEVTNPRDTFRESLKQGFIRDGNGWSEMLTMRNLTSHTYDEKQAKKVVAFLRAEGLTLLEALEHQFDEMTEVL